MVQPEVWAYREGETEETGWRVEVSERRGGKEVEEVSRPGSVSLLIP